MELALIVIAVLAAIFGLPIAALVRATKLERRLVSVEREMERLRRQVASPEAPEERPASQPRPQIDLGAPPPEPSAPAEPEPEPAEVPPPSEPEAARPAAAAPAPAMRGGMERTVGTKWTVWVGGLALALGAIFLVRYTIEEGLLGPGVRVTLGWLLAAALIAAGEFLRRRELSQTVAGVPSAYVPGVLTAAGILAAFASTYAAYALYGFLPPLAAFILLAACSVAALSAAWLHGPGLAAVGLVGSYVTPALVASESPSAWALFSYLVFVTAASYFVARLKLWLWLAVSATAAAVLWGLAWCAGTWTPGDVLPLGLYVLALVLLAFFLLAEDTPRDPADQSEPPLLAGLDWWSTGIIAALSVQLAPAVRLDAYDTTSLLLLGAVSATLIAGAWQWRSLAALVPWMAMLFGFVYLGWHIPKMLSAPIGPFDAYMGLAPITPPGLVRFLTTGAVFGAAFAASGFLMALDATRHRFWVLTSASTPIVLFAYAYLRATNFEHSVPFGVLALGLAFLYVAAADLVQRRGSEELWGWRAGCYAASAVAALALAFTIVLEKGWLTIALALICPGLGWVASKRPVPGLRYLAAGMAAIVLARFVYDPMIIGYALGDTLIFNWLLYGYGLPAVAFATAAWMFRRQRDDITVQVLEAAAIVCVVALVGLEVRHALNDGDIYASSFDLAELSIHAITMLALAIGLQRIYDRLGRITAEWAATILGVIGLAVILFGLLLGANPLFTGEPVGGGRFFNVLLLAYVVPAILCALLYGLARGCRHALWVAAVGAAPLLLIFTYLSLEVRLLFHGPVLTEGPTTDAEWYTYSAVWLLYGVCLLAAGIVSGLAALRYASLGILILTVCKVFLFDLSNLTGILRALSFIGLGLVLVAIGYFYQRVVLPQSALPPPPDEPTEPA